MVHKGACDRGLCADRGWNRHDPATMEISVLPVYLGRSLGLNWEKAGELADDMGAV